MAEAIRETVSVAILFELRDPRVKNVTVVRAEVAGDLRSAKIYISVRGDDRTQALTMHGLNSARGFLQKKVADRLQTRYTPILTFLLDQSLKRTAETAAVLAKVEAEWKADDPASQDEASDAEDFDEQTKTESDENPATNVCEPGLAHSHSPNADPSATDAVESLAERGSPPLEDGTTAVSEPDPSRNSSHEVAET